MPPSKIIIIGGGQAGAQAAFSLRQGGYDETLTIIAQEAVFPYQRPPLSKAYMKGEMSQERLFLKPQSWYEQNNVDLRPGVSARTIARHDKKIMLDNGEARSYDKLIIATGARPRMLSVPGANSKNVFVLRSLSDVDTIRPAIKDKARLVIIGAGYIGLEAAAVARQLGLEVTLVELASRILSRVTGDVISKFYTDYHRKQGVRIITDTGINKILDKDGSATNIELSNGEILDADCVLVGIGVLPNTEFAEEAGLEVNNGIIVDDQARTSDCDIYAIGDCAHRPLAHYGRTGRLESVHNAIEQGKIAAASILEKPQPRLDCPWFWSDQYDIKLQIAGLSEGADHTIVRGNPNDHSFAVFYFRAQKLIAVDAVNRPQEFLIGKKIILTGNNVQDLPFADESTSPKQLADMATQ